MATRPGEEASDLQTGEAGSIINQRTVHDSSDLREGKHDRSSPTLP